MMLIGVGTPDGADIPTDEAPGLVQIEVMATIAEARAVARMLGDEIAVVATDPPAPKG